jgi:hypothetical protein
MKIVVSTDETIAYSIEEVLNYILRTIFLKLLVQPQSSVVPPPTAQSTQ